MAVEEITSRRIIAALKKLGGMRFPSNIAQHIAGRPTSPDAILKTVLMCQTMAEKGKLVAHPTHSNQSCQYSVVPKAPEFKSDIERAVYEIIAKSEKPIAATKIRKLISEDKKDFNLSEIWNMSDRGVLIRKEKGDSATYEIKLGTGRSQKGRGMGEKQGRPVKWGKDGLIRALEMHDGNIQKAAESIGMPYATAHRLSKEINQDKQQGNLPLPPQDTRPEKKPEAAPEKGNGRNPQELIALGIEKLIGSAKAPVDADTVRKIVKDELKAIPPREIVIKAPDKAPKKMDGVMPKYFKAMLRKLSAGVNVYLVGPAGCGKTYAAMKAADALDLRFDCISLSAGVSESMLTGWLVPGKGGEFVYLPASFVDFYENGGLYLLDEIDAADPNVLVIINAALANGHLAIPHRREKSIAQRHKDFRVIACANTYGHGATRDYQGRNALDAATLDRFVSGRIVCDYDTDVEKSITDPEVLAWGLAIREKIKRHGLRRIMSTRVMEDMSTLKAAGEKRKDWEDSYFADWSKSEKEKIGG